MQSPINVYLDSSDFSRLSNPNRDRNDAELANKLLLFSRDGQVRFLFSGTHLTEMAPLDAQFTASAVSRANYLVDLCGRNSLHSFDRILKSELMCLVDPYKTLPPPYSGIAEWYPEWGNLVGPVQWVETLEIFESTCRAHGLNRDQRRALKRKIFKDGRLKKDGRSAPNFESEVLDQFVSAYPMREQDAKVLFRYALGDASSEEANEAFLEGLRDPRWMMQWFSCHHEELTPFINWVREPAKKLFDVVNAITEHIRQLQIHLAHSSITSNADLLTSDWWHRQADTLVENISLKLLRENYPNESKKITFQDVDKRCPGFSTVIRSAHSTIRDLTLRSPRKNHKASIYVDSLHSIYAPYVDIFRADRYMTPHIQRAAKHYSTIIVPSLNDLAMAIEQELSLR